MNILREQFRPDGPSNAEVARAWETTVEGWIARIDLDDVFYELQDGFRLAFLEAVKAGDAAKVGAVVMDAVQTQAERRAQMYGDDHS